MGFLRFWKLWCDSAEFCRYARTSNFGQNGTFVQMARLNSGRPKSVQRSVLCSMSVRVRPSYLKFGSLAFGLDICKKSLAFDLNRVL
ncbi:hypothetical protein LR48_Vigan34s001700 [Vigna angularis]|uniref:Uncharacterized protein n=1 Tax=Phaseolus angularis TaxID=3914 RepID=A0A0L9T337_PHAAN|nr:hypothetical protein LR48_Vigan34s001700 [Vigna angularis]